MLAFARYSLLRLLLLAATLALFWVLGARGLLLVVLAVVAAVALSYVLLRGPREAAVAALSAEVESRRRRGDAAEPGASDEDVEDALVDADGGDPSPTTGSEGRAG